MGAVATSKCKCLAFVFQYIFLRHKSAYAATCCFQQRAQDRRGVARREGTIQQPGNGPCSECPWAIKQNSRSPAHRERRPIPWGLVLACRVAHLHLVHGGMSMARAGGMHVHGGNVHGGAPPRGDRARHEHRLNPSGTPPPPRTVAARAPEA